MKPRTGYEWRRNQPDNIMKKQHAVVARIDPVNGNLDIQELNQLLDQGWEVTATEPSSSGSILVVLEKEE